MGFDNWKKMYEKLKVAKITKEKHEHIFNIQDKIHY